MIEHLVGLLALSMMATGLLVYALQEPQRILDAQVAQLMVDLDEAMTLYAQNCSVCHGLSGEGIGATPALDNPALREGDAAALAKIIARGLYGTAMPAWSKEDGGPLGDYQIETLVALIQAGDWQQTQDRVVNLGLAPQVPFTTKPDAAILEAVKALPDGATLAAGITLYSEQCVACHGADGMGTGLAPALNDPAVRDKSAAEIERTILNGVPGTLMATWQNALSLEQVSNLVALVTRWDEVPTGAIPAPDRPVPVTAESMQLGADLYAQSCSRCHGPDGQGSGRAPALNVKTFLTSTNDVAMQQIITLGVPSTAMPAWGDRLLEPEIQAIVGFIRSWEATAPEVASPVRGPWWATNGSSPARGGPGALPSGGALPTSSAGGATTGNNAGSSAGSGSNAGTGSGQGQGIGAAAGSTQGQTHTGETGGPPWAQPAPAPWWQTLDWRMVALLGGGLSLALGLVAAALFGLRRV